MIRSLLVALSASAVALSCNTRGKSTSAPQCAVDSASLARTARASLARLGLPVPNIEVALEVTQRRIRVSGSERLVVTASWGGPSNGVTLLADCSGTILDGEASGYVRAVDLLVPDTERTLIKLRAITGTGSGWKQESIHLYAPGATDLALVWSGVVSERSYQAAAVGAYEQEGELTYIGRDSLVYSAIRFPVAMSQDGTWTRQTERGEPTVTTYDWNPDTHRYEQRLASPKAPGAPAIHE